MYIQDFDQALIIFEKILKMKKQIHGEDHISLGTTFNNIASVHLKRGK